MVHNDDFLDNVDDPEYTGHYPFYYRTINLENNHEGTYKGTLYKDGDVDVIKVKLDNDITYNVSFSSIDSQFNPAFIVTVFT